MSSLELGRETHILPSLARGVLNVGGVLLIAACASPKTPLTEAELDAYAAGLSRVPVASIPTPEPTEAPVFPAATPRPPELTATIAITLPDGTKATVTIPPFTATLVPATATPDKIVRVENIPEKSPLKRYAIFRGYFLNPQTKSREGVGMVASIPTEDGKEKIFFYYVKLSNRLSAAFETPAENVQNNAFQIRSKAGQNENIEVSLDPKGKFLTGTFTAGPGPISFPEFQWQVTLELEGIQPSGEKADVVDSIKWVKNTGTGLNSPNYRTVAINELKKTVDFEKWPPI